MLSVFEHVFYFSLVLTWRVCTVYFSITSGTGVKTGCIVDIGHRRTRVTCVDDGLVVPGTSLSLPYPPLTPLQSHWIPLHQFMLVISVKYHILCGRRAVDRKFGLCFDGLWAAGPKGLEMAKGFTRAYSQVLVTILRVSSELAFVLLRCCGLSSEQPIAMIWTMS